MTLLEVMIVLAILALVMGLVIGPMVMKNYDESRKRAAKLAVGKYVYEAYPMWVQSNPEKSCPSSLKDLGEFTNSKGDRDPWGQPFHLRCGPDLPPGATGIAVASNGPDQRPDTEDDIRSW